MTLPDWRERLICFKCGSREGSDFTHPRDARNLTKVFSRRAAKLGFSKLRFHDLRGTHETLLLDAGIPVHVVAARCGHDPAVLLRTYARRTKRADTSAAAVIGALSKGGTRGYLALVHWLPAYGCGSR